MRRVATFAAAAMMAKSRAIAVSTPGWRTLTATTVPGFNPALLAPAADRRALYT